MSISASITGDSNSFYLFIKNTILQRLTEGSGNELTQIMDSFVTKINTAKLGISGIAGFIVTLILLLRNIELTLNKIWDIKKERSLMSRFIKFGLL